MANGRLWGRTYSVILKSQLTIVIFQRLLHPVLRHPFRDSPGTFRLFFLGARHALPECRFGGWVAVSHARMRFGLAVAGRHGIDRFMPGILGALSHCVGSLFYRLQRRRMIWLRFFFDPGILFALRRAVILRPSRGPRHFRLR